MRALTQLAGGLLASVILGTLSHAQVGAPFPDIDFKDLAQTEAKSFDDFSGRLVLVELFAYW